MDGASALCNALYMSQPFFFVIHNMNFFITKEEETMESYFGNHLVSFPSVTVAS